MMMYLSQLVLNRMDRSIMKVLSDVYQLHQFIMSGFEKFEETQRVLFRVESEIIGRAVKVLVQSQDEPDWRQKAADIGGLEQFQTKNVNLQFTNGQIFRFRLRANPVVTRNGKRYGIIREEALMAWLKKKEKRIGTSFISVLPIDEGYVTGHRDKAGRKSRIQIKIARFEGILKVIDSDRFNESIILGIGPAKGFGCGLLSIAPA
jgi:CRISPR system Cascade subunit CasE